MGTTDEKKTPAKRARKAVTMAAPPADATPQNEGAGRVPASLAGERARLVVTGNYSPPPGQPRYNPDDLVTKKGLEIYEQMRNDDQVQAVMSLKKHAVLSTPIEVVPGSSSEIDKLIAEFIRWNLTAMEGSIEASMFEILSAFDFGFSATEKVFRVIEDGELPEFNGLIGWKAWKTKSPFPWWFEQDEFGNLLPTGLVQQTSAGLLRIPREKFILYSHGTQFQNPYGRSDLRAAYRPWFSKDWAIRFMNRLIEKFGSPTPVAKVPNNIDPADLAKVQSFLKNWQAMTSGTVPEGVIIELMESKAQAALNFIEIITKHDQAIARAALLPDLLGFSGSGRAGSYALGKTHFKVFLQVIQSIRRVLEEQVLMEQAVKQLVDFNWSGVRRYPRLVFQRIDDEDIQSRAQTIQMMVQIGVINPREGWVRPYLNFPTMSPSDETALAAPNSQFRKLVRLFAEQHIMPRSFECPQCSQYTRLRQFVYDRQSRATLHPECARRVSPQPGRYALVSPGAPQEVRETLPDPRPTTHEYGGSQEAKGAGQDTELRRPRTFAERTTNFAKLVKAEDSMRKAVVARASDVFRTLRHQMLDKLDALAVWKKLLDPAKGADAVAKAKGLKLNMGPFRKLVYNACVCSALNGRWQAMVDVAQRARRSNVAKAFVEDDADVILEPMDPADAVRFFGKKKVVVGGQTVKLALSSEELDFYDRRTFTIAGIESDRILADVQNSLLLGLKSGDPAKAKEDVASIFDRYIQSGEIDEEGTLLSPSRIDTIVRTNVNEAYNEGRKALYEDEGVREEVQGYQWSSIVDRNVTPYCEAMDEQIFRVEQISNLFPPAHFQCRSTVVPVMVGETGFSYSEKDPMNPDGVPRAEGFCACHARVQIYTTDELVRLYGTSRGVH